MIFYSSLLVLYFLIVSFATDPANIYSGNKVLENTLYPSPLNTVSVSVPLNLINSSLLTTNYELAYSIRNIDDYQLSSIMNLGLSCTKKSSQILCLFYVNNGIKWGHVTFIYIISTRNDFRCGSFQQTLQPPLFEMTPYFLQKPWNFTVAQSLITFVPFISALNSADTNFQLKILDSSLVLAYQALVFNLAVTNYQLLTSINLEISYVIFAEESDYFVQSAADVTIIPTDDYFIGIVGVKYNSTSTTTSSNQIKTPLSPSSFNTPSSYSSSVTIGVNNLNSLAWFNNFDVKGLTIKSDIVNFYMLNDVNITSATTALTTTKPTTTAPTTTATTSYTASITSSFNWAFNLSNLFSGNTSASNSSETGNSGNQTKWSDFFQTYDKCDNGNIITNLEIVYAITAEQKPVQRLSKTLYQNILTIQNYFQSRRTSIFFYKSQFQRISNGTALSSNELILYDMIRTMSSTDYETTKKYFQKVPNFVLISKMAYVKSCINCGLDEIFVASKKKCMSSQTSLTTIYPQLSRYIPR